MEMNNKQNEIVMDTYDEIFKSKHGMYVYVSMKQYVVIMYNHILIMS